MAKQKDGAIEEKRMYNLVCSNNFSDLKEGQSELADRIDAKLTETESRLRKVEQKAFNGFDTRMTAMEKSLKNVSDANETAHTDMKRSISGIVKWAAGTFVMMVVLVLTLLGTFAHSRWEASQEAMKVEVIDSAPNSQSTE